MQGDLKSALVRNILSGVATGRLRLTPRIQEEREGCIPHDLLLPFVPTNCVDGEQEGGGGIVKLVLALTDGCL